MSDRITIRTEHLTIEGSSRAGHETWFRVRELGVALDIGRCPDPVVSVPNVFVTHAHLDHAAGVPYYAGQRRLQGLEPGRIFIPRETEEDFRALMTIHERLEGVDYDIEITGMTAGDVVPLGRNHLVRAHDSTHRVPARAWEFLERRHHLKPEYAALGGGELARLRRQGETIHDEAQHSILFYTGDTDRGILEKNEAIYRAEIVMIECSFIGDGHRDRAERYRHIHFDDIADFAERFENQMIVLTHFSRRYSGEEIVRSIRRRCPAVLRDRLRLALAEPFSRI